MINDDQQEMAFMGAIVMLVLESTNSSLIGPKVCSTTGKSHLVCMRNLANSLGLVESWILEDNANL